MSGQLALPPLPDDPAPGPIVAFGDSYTEGWGAAPEQSYPSLLAGHLGIPVLNMGVSGETAAEALTRLQTDVLDRRPRLVIVAFGTNELFRGQPLSTCIVALEAMLTAFDAAGIQSVLVGVHFGAYQENLDIELLRLADLHRTGLVLNALGGIIDDPGLTSDGGFHPNAAGYAILAERIQPEVERILGLHQ